MEYQEFVREICRQVQSRAGEERSVSVRPLMRNNSVVRDSLCIRSHGDQAVPAVCLDDCYADYCSGTPTEDITDRILRIYEGGRRGDEFDFSFFTDGRRASSRIVGRIVGRRDNERLLQQAPHRDFLDLAVIYYYLMEAMSDSMAGILIRHEHLALWDMDVDELDHLAVTNTHHLLPPAFRTMGDILGELGTTSGDFDLKEMMEEAMPPICLYVLTNSLKCHGSVYMADPNVLSHVQMMLEEDYYILPSSVHECIILPDSMARDAGELTEMVREINRTQVAPEERLSDSVYHYSSGEGLQIASE